MKEGHNAGLKMQHPYSSRRSQNHSSVTQFITLRSVLLMSGVAVIVVSLAATGYARFHSNWSVRHELFASSGRGWSDYWREIRNKRFRKDPRRLAPRAIRTISSDESQEDDGHRVAEVAYREGLVSSEQPTDPGRGTSRNARILEQEEGAEDVPRKDRVVPNISEDASHAGEIETIPGKILGNAETIWEQLLRAKPPKIDPRQYGHQETHALQDFHDQGQVLATIDGAVVVRRRDVVEDVARFYPASGLDFLPTFQSYFSIFQRSLVPRVFFSKNLRDKQKGPRSSQFWNAVSESKNTAALYLSTYIGGSEEEVRQEANAGYEPLPSVSSMANVYITPLGTVFNRKDCIVLKTCKSEAHAHFKPKPPRSVERYEKVFVMTQHWGDGYFHFVSECLPRITLMLDLLLEYPEIKIAVHVTNAAHTQRREYMSEFVELLGISRSRLIFVKKSIHAKVAFIPESTPCGHPLTAGIILLRSALLKALYPETGGVVPPTSRPVIIFIMRNAKRGLMNNAEVEEALRQNFPEHDVIRFLGRGSIRSQLVLFSKASLIVAPHGAGLSNMMVAPLHTPVLEIGPPTCPDCYIQLAIKLQHLYGRHPAVSTWDAACEHFYKPDVKEVMAIARALMEARALVGTTDTPPPSLSGDGRQLASNVSGCTDSIQR